MSWQQFYSTTTLDLAGKVSLLICQSPRLGPNFQEKTLAQFLAASMYFLSKTGTMFVFCEPTEHFVWKEAMKQAGMVPQKHPFYIINDPASSKRSKVGPRLVNGTICIAFFLILVVTTAAIGHANKLFNADLRHRVSSVSTLPPYSNAINCYKPVRLSQMLKDSDDKPLRYRCE